MKLFDLTLKLNGFPINEAQKKLQAIQNISEKDFETSINQLKFDLIAYHLKHNAFYKGFINNQPVSTWSQVPIMQKSDLQKPLQDRLSQGFTPKNCYVNKTSGSSGHPFVFAKDRFCHAMTWAQIMDRFNWLGIDFNYSLQARFYGIPLNRYGYLKERLKDRLTKRYRFPIFNLSNEKLAQFLLQFKRKKFDYINGYTSAIVLFAKYVLQQGLVLKEVCPTLKYCVVTSEMLFDTDKQLIEKAFNIPVINEYGASELDLIAFTNPQGEFIVNSETLFVEIVDAQGVPVQNGVEGRIVITSLFNKAHPLIRYDIGDTGSFSKNSTLKKPLLKTLTGRTNDVAKLPSGKVVPGLTFYYVTKSVIEDDTTVKEFVVEQKALDHFHITYVASAKLTPQEIEKIKTALHTYLEPGLRLTFKQAAILDRANRGKLKQFIALN